MVRFQVARNLAPDETLQNTALMSRHVEELVRLTRAAWRGTTRELRRQFPFIKDTALREIAERDFASLVAARQQEEVKTALIMAGSVIEAVLLDLMGRDPAKAETAARVVLAKRGQTNPRVWPKSFDPTNLDAWTLAQLVAIAGPIGLGVLTERAEQMADVVRDWRNFVHPRQERAETKSSPLGLSDAKAAEALVERVLEDVARFP